MLTENDILEAMGDLSTLPYFPVGDFAQAAVAKHLEKIVDEPERLRWLVENYVAKAGKWGGIAELRALYSTRWKPADGIEGGDCTIAGHTPEENESRYIEEHATQKKLPGVEGMGALRRLK